MATETGATSQTDTSTVDGEAPVDPNAGKTPGKDPVLSARERMLADLDSKIEQQRQQDYDTFLRSAEVDPAAAELAVRMQREARGENWDQPADEVPAPEVEQTPAPAAKPAQRVSQKGEDPLGDYIVRVEGKPMMKTVVNGQERLVPLDTARASLQKHLSADIRLEQAAKLKKELDAREAQLRNTEATLRARSQPPAQAAADDKSLDTEAVELVRSLVNEPEAQAAARLAKTLKTIRQASAPNVDPEAIAKAAADRAVRTIAERDNARALQGGLEQFTKDYPDIASDSDLFNLADRKTNAIAEAHPDWTPTQVMSEAGKQTREWLKSLGAPVKAPGGSTPSGEPNKRQQLKQKLVPMPQSRVVRTPAPTSEEGGQAPSDYIAELRKARGQGS